MLDISLVVLAKAPVAGRVKTRLCPSLTPVQAAAVARAALLDTLDVVASVPVRRRVVALDGSPHGLVPQGFDVVPQRGDGLDSRLAAAFADITGPALLIGMDTPQVTVNQLVAAVLLLATGRPVLGHAQDGGWWAIGLPTGDPEVFLGVPMSAADTGRCQERRMRQRGLDPVLLPVLRDIDHMDDLVAASRVMPAASRVASVVRDLLVPA
jgi:rSAM/selenodomain-associated transferase 1